MIKQLKTFTVKMVAGANVASAVVMWLVGFSDYANPVSHPYIACAGLLFPVFLLINLGFLFFWLAFHRRMIFIPILGYAAAFVPLRIYMPINAGGTTPPAGSIKMVTWNVHGFTTPAGEQSAADIAGFIKNSAADIVCLQEDNGAAPGHSAIDSIFPHHSTDIVAEDKGNSVGIYTRFPIVRKERIPYPSKGNGSMAYYLKIRKDTVIVINNHFESTHLSLDERQRYKNMLKGKMGEDTVRAESKRLLRRLGESSALRAPQADAVHAYIEAHRAYPLIVCGDFNDNPISYTRRIVAKDLTDCYVSTGRGIGLSYNQKGFFVRIDNMMCSSQFKPYNCKVHNNVDVSDHYPMSCWLERRPKQ